MILTTMFRVTYRIKHMEMRQRRVSVYKTMMRRRSFTNWANSLLRSLDKQIVDIFNPNERELLDALLEAVLAKSKKKLKLIFPERRNELELLLGKVEQFKNTYFKPRQGQGNYSLIPSDL